MDVMGYIVQEGLIIVPALLIIGMMIKQIPKIPNWTIPLVLLVTGAAVYGNQIWKQILYAKEDDEEPSEDTTE